MQGHLFHIGAMAKPEFLGEFQTRHTLQNIKHELFRYTARADQMIAMILVLQGEFKRQDLKPEGLIIQWLQPLFNVIDIAKLSHGFKIANPISGTQILNAKRGSPWLTV